MTPKRVLVAFSSRSGSTAGTAETIAGVLEAAGLAVDCRPKEEVADVTAYHAVVLGSGMFVASRASDGGGFLERHAEALRGCDVWLFCAGPIGGRPGHGAGPAEGEWPVEAVGRAIGARGVAKFGTIGMRDGADPVAELMPANGREVRSWAESIAAALGSPNPTGRTRRHGCRGVAAAG